MESDIIEKRAGHKTIKIGEEMIQVPRDITPEEENRIRREVHKRQLDQKLGKRPKPNHKINTDNQDETENMTENPTAVSEAAEFFIFLGIVSTFGGMVIGALYTLWTVFNGYGIPGLAAAMTVGGIVLAVTAFAIEVLRNRD